MTLHFGQVRPRVATGLDPPLSHPRGHSASLLAATALTHVVFLGEDRYHLAVSPCCDILAAAALRVQTTVTGPSVSANSR